MPWLHVSPVHKVKGVQPPDDTFGSKLGCNRADSRIALNQWETPLQSNAVSHWLGTNQESALYYNSPPVPGVVLTR